MARFLVEILINAAGGPKARAAFDDVGASASSAAKRVTDAGLQSERALRRTAEAAERLKDQMEETKASKGLISDLSSLNARLKEQIAALNGDAAALSRYEQKEKEAAQAQRILTAQVKAGVSAQSGAGKEIADAIRLHDRYQDELRQTARALAQAQTGGTGTSRISGVISTAGSFINTATAITATLVGLGYSIKRLTDAASESEGVLAQLRAGLESTGGASGQTVQSLDDLASSLSRLSGQDDEVIAGAEAILLTFTKVGGEVFPAATAAALDMSVRMKQDLNSSILLVGKALNDPIKGVTALTRSGVQFTESQKNQIKTLVETGHLLEAQAIILKELQIQFGGSAAAARDTLGGALAAVRVETGNLIEIFAGSLSPVIRELAEDYIRWAQSAEAQKEIAEWGNLLADAVRAIAAASELAAPALKLVSIEAKILLTVITSLLEAVGWVVEKVGFARDTYLGWARDTGILRDAITSSTPLIQEALQTQMDAVFNLREEYGKLGQAAIQAAQDQMTAMEAEAFAASTQAQRNRELLKTREETRKRNAGIGAGKDTGPSEVDRELLRQTIELEKHAANLNNIITRQTLRLNEHAAAAKRSSEETETFGESQLDAQAAARKLLDDLLDEVDTQRKVTAGAKESTSAHKASTLAREQEAKAEQIRTAFIKAGLGWTEKNTAAIYGAVKALRELKSQEDAALKFRELILKVTVDTSDLDKKIAASAKIQVEIDSRNRAETFKVAQANREAFEAQRESVRQQLEEQALYFRDSLTTPREELDRFNRLMDELGKVTDSTGESVLKATDIEKLRAKALADYTNDRFRQQTDALGHFFDTLADEFGGLFSYLSQAISALQKGGDFGSSVGQIAGMMGAQGTVGYGGFGGTGAVGAAAGVGAAAYVWYQLYKTIDGLIKDSKTRNYGTRVDYQSTGGVDSFSYVTKQGEGAAKAIRDAVDAVAEALGTSVVDLPKIGLAIRNDGKRVKAYIEGELIGVFGSVDEAIDAALREVLTNPKTKLEGINDLMQQYLGKVTAGVDLDELVGFLGQLREIGNLSLSQGAIQLQQIVTHFDRLFDTLTRLGSATPAVLEGLDGIRAGVVSAFQDWADSISGRQKTPEEVKAEKEREKVLFENQKALSIARWQMEILDLKKQAESLKARGSMNQREGDIDVGRIQIRSLYLSSMVELTEAEAGVENQRLALIAAQIAAIQAIIDQVGQITIPDITIPGTGRGGRGGGGVSKKDLRAGLLDEIGRIQAELQGPLHAAFFDFRERLEDFKKRAKEAGLSATDTAAGIAALTEQFRRQIDQQARTLAGLDTDFTTRLRDIQQFFDELRDLGRGKTGMPKWLVEVLEGKALDKLGLELQGAIAEFGGLTDPMLAIQIQAQTLRTNLLAFAEAAGWSSEQIAEAQAAINAGVEYQRQQGMNSVLDRLFDWMKKAGIETSKAVEHERKKALLDLQIIEAQLRFYGALTEETQGWIQEVRDFINGPDFGGGIKEALEDFTAKQSDWWSQNFGGGAVWDSVIEAIQDWRQLVKDEMNNIQSLYTNDNLTGLTQQQQYEAAQARFRDLAAKRDAGDLEAAKELERARQEYLSEARESFGGGDSGYGGMGTGFTSVWKEILQESGDWLSGAKDNEQNVIQKALQDMQSGANDNAQMISEAVYDGAAQVVAAIYKMIGGVPKFANGGLVMQPTLGIIAEKGPELITPLSSIFYGRDAPTQRSPSPRDERSAPSISLIERRMMTALGKLETRLAAIEASNDSVAQSNNRLARAESRRAMGEQRKRY